MQLSKAHKVSNPKEIIKTLVATISQKVQEHEGVLTHKHKESASDAIAILTSLEAKIDSVKPEYIKDSITKASKLVRAAFSEDFAPLNFREEIKESQKALVTEVEPRSLGEGRVLESHFPEENGFNTPKNTASPYDPARVAELIMRDVRGHYYGSMQEAYEGYTGEHGPYPFASATQKYELGRILQAFGFVVKFDKWEKKAKEEKDAYLAKLEKKSKQQRKADVAPDNIKDIQYCTQCGKSTGHTKGQGSTTCNSCGTIKKKKAAIALSKFAQLDSFAPSPPNVLELTKNKLKSLYQNFQKALAPADINKAFYDSLQEAKVDPAEFSDPQEKGVIVNELKQFLRDNQIPVIDQQKQAWLTTSDMKCEGCGTVMANMYRMADDQACPKCGGRLMEANVGEAPNSSMPNNMPSNPSVVDMFMQQNQSTPSNNIGGGSQQIF